MSRRESVMKYCPECKKEYDDGVGFCPECGAVLEQTQTPEPSVSTPPEVVISRSVSAPKPKKEEKAEKEKSGSKKIVLIAVLVVVLVAAAVFAVKALTGGDDPNEDESSTLGGNISQENTVENDSTSEKSSDGEEKTDTDTASTSKNDATENEQTNSGEITSGNSAEEQSSNSGGNTVSGTNEYEILRTGTFYVKGSMVDETGLDTPMEWAKTPDSFYALSDFEGMDMGMLIKNNEMYMIYAEKKAYLKMSDEIMKFANLDVSELTEAADSQFNFVTWPALSEAEKTSTAAHDGHSCTVYHFTSEGGTEKRIYLDGEKLVRIANYSANGTFVSALDVDEVSATPPAGTTEPPSDFKAYEGITGIVSFMLLFKDAF